VPDRRRQNQRRIGRKIVPEPAIYEVRAIGVKLSARQNRQRGAPGPDNLSRSPRFHQNADLLKRIRLMLPVQSPQLKIFRFAINPNQIHICAVLSHRGAARDRHGRGAGCDGRGWRFRRRRLRRTAKSCGPDASTLAFKLAQKTVPATVTNKPDHRGDHEGNR